MNLSYHSIPPPFFIHACPTLPMPSILFYYFEIIFYLLLKATIYELNELKYNESTQKKKPKAGLVTIFKNDFKK